MTTIGLMHYAPVPPPLSRQLLDEAKKRGAKTIYVRPTDIAIIINEREAKPLVLKRSRPLELDILFVRGTMRSSSIEEASFYADIVISLELNDVLTINKMEAIIRARDKLLTSMLLLQKGLPVPPSIASLGMNMPLEKLKEWGKGVNKPLIGSLGRGVIPLENPDIAYSVFRQLLAWSQPILIQKIIEKPGNKDLRVLVIKGDVVAYYYRVAEHGEFKTNISQGGRVEKAKDIDKNVLEDAIKAVEALGLFYGGVDIIVGREGHFIIEVNAMPNWRGALELGVNPAPILVDAALEELRR